MGSSNGAVDTFSLDAHSGVITTRVSLDREATQVYTIIVLATDQALPTSERRLVIIGNLVKSSNLKMTSKESWNFVLPRNGKFPI